MTLSHSELLECNVCFSAKPEEDFYDGVKTRCKECHKAAMKLRRLTDPRVQEFDRERSKTPERKAAARQVSIRWRQKHPDAYRAQTAVNNAVRDKRLAKGPCSICGTDEDVHGHHKDYSKPLDVIWLCAKCHHRIHATFPELGGNFRATE